MADDDKHKGKPAPIVPPRRPGSGGPSGDGSMPPGGGKHAKPAGR